MLKERYNKRKEELLNDKKIVQSNRTIFKKFFEFEEKKIKRTNNLRELDEKGYKTLILYVHYFRKTNEWFKNKEWRRLTKKDINNVFEDLENGVLKKSNGEPYEDRRSYYNKVFKSKPFALARKKELAQEVIEYVKPSKTQEVKYMELEDIKKILMVAINPLRFWLSFDTTENIGTILALQKKNCVRQINKDTQEEEYIINLPQDKIKRSRTTRSVLTNFKETTELLDIVLKDLKDEDYLFTTGLRQAEKDFKKAVEMVEVKCKPNGEKPTPKDLISSCVCHLLEIGWSLDEIRARKGHQPSSTAIDKYANYKAISSHKPKIKTYQNNLDRLTMELKQAKEKEELTNMRLEKNTENIHKLTKVLTTMLKNTNFNDKEKNGEMIVDIMNTLD